MRKTKIVCTLGPSAEKPETIKKLIKAGLNVARLNMSHGTHDEHHTRAEVIKKLRSELCHPVALLFDTKGPEIRIKRFKDNKITLEQGDKFILTTNEVLGDNTQVSVTYSDLPRSVKKGQKILLNDGLIEFKVIDTDEFNVYCEVIDGGELTNSKSINLPDGHIDMPYLSDADKEDILFAIKEDADYIALSFVRSADDVKIIRNLINRNGGEKIQLIAKIENREGVDNVAEIIESADGIMIARGDMGVEIPFEELPGIQKSLIQKCYRAGKKVITATQMLESMINNPRPTRAEISDVANAIYDGTSAIMLSGETAAGKYPVESVKTMAKIAEKTENSINFFKRFGNSEHKISTVTDAVCHSTVAAAFDLKAKAIIAVSHSGYTVRNVSRFRPECTIIGVTLSEKVYNQLSLNWGVSPAMSVMQKTSEELFDHAIYCAKCTGYVKNGDLVILTGGSAVGKSGNSNMMRIETV